MEGILLALQELLSINHMFYLSLGVAIGMTVGFLPGLGGIAGLSLVLPFLYDMPPSVALAMMIALTSTTSCSDVFPSILIGVPGTSGSQATVIVLRQLLMRLGLPLVVDADALRVLGSAGSIPRAQLILTPHPGEMATLAGIHKDDVQQNREAIARTVAKKFGAVCVLKGYHTVITDGDTLLINPTGNPGMATGGSGDVLAGMIAALVMQVKAPQLLHAAAAGVYLHGMAGDIAVRHTTQMSLLAGDITENLPAALHALRIR